MRFVAVILAFLTPIGARAVDSEALRVDAATRYLQNKYRGSEKLPDGSVAIRDLTFFPEQARLIPFKEPLLARLRPDTTFYASEIATPYYEYDPVEVLVSVRATQSGYDVRSILSPVFKDDSAEFVEQFHGLAAASRADKAALTKAIASLLVPITYKGSVRTPSRTSDRFSIELWHDELHWRDVVVGFTPAGAVQSVEVVNPKQQLNAD